MATNRFPSHIKELQLLTVATDGSRIGGTATDGPTGWAYAAQDGRFLQAGSPAGTNNTAELSAVLMTLLDFPTEPVLVLSDSKYAIGACTTWKPGWQRRGYRKADGNPVLNLDLVQSLHHAIDVRRAQLEFEWVKGHTGHPLNERADSLANEAARAAGATGTSALRRGRA